VKPIQNPFYNGRKKRKTKQEKLEEFEKQLEQFKFVPGGYPHNRNRF
jgi:ribosomal protein L31